MLVSFSPADMKYSFFYADDTEAIEGTIKT